MIIYILCYRGVRECKHFVYTRSGLNLSGSELFLRGVKAHNQKIDRDGMRLRVRFGEVSKRVKSLKIKGVAPIFCVCKVLVVVL